MKKARPSVYIDISYEELGEYVVGKEIVQVNKKWLDAVTSSGQTKKGCSKCKQFLPLDAFNNDKRRKFGKRSQCKSCYKNRFSETVTSPAFREIMSGAFKVSDLTPKEEPKIEYQLINLNE